MQIEENTDAKYRITGIYRNGSNTAQTVSPALKIQFQLKPVLQFFYQRVLFNYAQVLLFGA